MSKQYINEEKARELFEEELNEEYTASGILKLDIYSEVIYDDLFARWLRDNEYHCQQKEYDKYEKETD